MSQLSCQGELKDLAGNREPRRHGGSEQEDLARKSCSRSRSYTLGTVTFTDEVRGAVIQDEERRMELAGRAAV
jgi:hypothetical protein